MSNSPNALAMTGPFIRGLIILNFFYAAAIGSLLLGTLIFPKLLLEALAGLADGEAAWQLRVALRTIVILGLAGAYVVHRVLRELLAIVATVHDGDPFVTSNARRLQAIACWVLAGEGLRLLVGAVVWGAARAAPSAGIDIDVGFSFAPWLAVLLLFVLARVFDQGARMRAELEGTV
jgi:hypothetical protein